MDSINELINEDQRIRIALNSNPTEELVFRLFRWVSEGVVVKRPDDGGTLHYTFVPWNSLAYLAFE